MVAVKLNKKATFDSTKRFINDEAGKANVTYVYRAFGTQLGKIGLGEARYTYGGKELDNETDLYYFNARYYDASVGRYISIDPAQDGVNWYIYCNNNPLSFVDPTGLFDEKQFAVGVFQFAGSLLAFGAATGTGIASEGISAPISVPVCLWAIKEAVDGCFRMISAQYDIK